MHIARWLFVLVLSYSCTAVAQPMRVTSQLSGDFVAPDPIVLGHLGHDLYDFTGEPIPFTLTLSAVIDPSAPLTNASSGRVGTQTSDVDVSLTVGGETTHFTNVDAFVSLTTSPSTYQMQVSFPHSSYIANFSTWLQGPAGSFDGQLALAPQDVQQVPGMTSGLTIMTYPPHPDMPGMWSTTSLASAGSLRIVSVVPEPVHAMMLCAGLLVLAGARRRQAASPRSRARMTYGTA